MLDRRTVLEFLSSQSHSNCSHLRSPGRLRMMKNTIPILLLAMACSTESAPVRQNSQAPSRADAGGAMNSSGQLAPPPSSLVVEVSDVSDAFNADGGFYIRELEGRAVYELSITGSRRNTPQGSIFPVRVQTLLTREEVRALMDGQVVQRPFPPRNGSVEYAYPGWTDPVFTEVTRWMRTLQLSSNEGATVSLRITLSEVFRYADGTVRAAVASATADVRGVPFVQCITSGPVPDTLMYDLRFESPFCRGALADTGLDRLARLSGTPMP